MRIAALALVTGAALVLAGCVPAGSHVTASPRPRATPVFASDEEALAAAEKAYAAYLAVSDQISNDGGANPERISKVATGRALTEDTSGFLEFGQKGWHAAGGTTLKSFRLQSVQDFLGSEGHGVVVAYACIDLSNVDVFDSSGLSVVSPARPVQQALEVGFDLVSTRTLLVASQDPWTGGGVCD